MHALEKVVLLKYHKYNVVKKFLLSLGLVLLVIPLVAQDLKEPWERYRPMGEIAIDAAIAFDPSDLYYYFGDNLIPGFSAEAVASYRFDEMFRLGLGAGFSSWRLDGFNHFCAGLPVYADLRCNLGEGKVSLFGEGRVGGIICLKKNHNEKVYEHWNGVDLIQIDKYISGFFGGMGFGLSVKRSNISIGAQWVRSKRDFRESDFRMVDQQSQCIETETESSNTINLLGYLRYTYSFGL